LSYFFLQALVEAQLNDVEYGALGEATCGIALFGTLHQGGEYAELSSVATNIFRCVLRRNVPSSFLDALRANSLYAAHLSDDFRHQLRHYRILSFFETQPYGNLGIVRAFCGLSLMK
jgi:hypothetical protein